MVYLDCYTVKRGDVMKKMKYVYYQEDGYYVGFLEEFPDYRTQGKTIEELKFNLGELYKDLTSGDLPHIYHVDELILA